METTRGILLIYNVLDSPEIKKCFFPFKSNFSIKFTKIILPLYYSNILKLTLNYTKEILKFSTNNLKSCSINNQLLQLQHLFFSIFSSLSSSNISLHINRNHNIPPYIILIFIPSLSQHLKTIKKKKKKYRFLEQPTKLSINKFIIQQLSPNKSSPTHFQTHFPSAKN